jgi:hypothetical protein
VAVLAGAAVLGAPGSARATFAIYLQEDSGAISQVASGADFALGGISFSGTFGSQVSGNNTDFIVSAFGGSSVNAATQSAVQSGTTTVTNNTAQTLTLHLWVVQTNYTLPAATSLLMESGVGGSVSTPTLTLSNIFQSWGDSANGNIATGAVPSFNNGLQSANPSGTTFDTGSKMGNFTRAAGAFSLASEVNFTLTGGGSANFSSTVKVTAVPAPPGLLLAASGVPFLALGWLRRRKA